MADKAVYQYNLTQSCATGSGGRRRVHILSPVRGRSRIGGQSADSCAVREQGRSSEADVALQVSGVQARNDERRAGARKRGGQGCGTKQRQGARAQEKEEQSERAAEKQAAETGKNVGPDGFHEDVEMWGRISIIVY
ncbi:hypothetical protein KL928_005031 [Ogataea angusta]|uniref:Uncharacterized protein n=1 Tax=Pichia angusta TaxID=870730 RepID=A0AAN6DCK1_PICAN|nr:uncharacterized protein KL928_005031 [Ogataea angusta]KAG7816065.1 hypothetical protein KL928_005031 [Ogataea angusta]